MSPERKDKSITHHNRTYAREQTRTDDSTDQMLVMAPRVANFCVIQKTNVLKQIKELLPKRINGFQSLCRKEILPTILITRLMSFSIFPTIICPDKSKMVAVIT